MSAADGLLSFRFTDRLFAACDADDEAVLKYASILFDRVYMPAPAAVVDALRERLVAGDETLRPGRIPRLTADWWAHWLRPVEVLEDAADWLHGLDLGAMRTRLGVLVEEGRLAAAELDEAFADPSGPLLRERAAPAYFCLRHDLRYHAIVRDGALDDAIVGDALWETSHEALLATIPDLQQLSWAAVLELRNSTYIGPYRNVVQGFECDGATRAQVQQALLAELLDHEEAARRAQGLGRGLAKLVGKAARKALGPVGTALGVGMLGFKARTWLADPADDGWRMLIQCYRRMTPPVDHEPPAA